MEEMKICKDGKLLETRWVYDEEKEEGEYITKDITDQAISRLFDVCTLEDGVTLKDIFLLLNTELDIFDAVLRNWTKEIVQEGLSQTEEKKNEYNPEEIEFLELYWYTYLDKSENIFGGFSRPSFHGIGWELKEDKMASWDKTHVEWPKGERIPWSLSFQSSKDLIHLPVKLNKTFPIYNEDVTDKVNYLYLLTKFEGAQYTLGNILYGIMWELSFHGGPEDRDSKGGELKDIAEKLKERDINTLPNFKFDE